MPRAIEARSEEGKQPIWNKFPKPAVILTVITLIAGVALSGVFGLTKDRIEAQNAAKERESYVAVCPGAETFETTDAITAAIEAQGEDSYGTDFGRVNIKDAVIAKDASGNVVGYVLSVTTHDGFDGDITLSLGISADGSTTGISFTELNETAGMGMRADEPEFKEQFDGRTASRFTLNKAGGSSAEDEINSVSGASITSGAVVNAVNAGLDFYENVMKGGN